ncbi:hypothetical protein M422DRAFT_258750 [Sphaerobolus stellatus SS14]|uniref:Uncharacterized protein n=1 Tax=Sphaerobolus stellatus (strain SS14) TaxID=990650 RepID=A0A0C9UUT7_SPHS4|nr:hypothetical protein M422DRAFT_258750 [Sphaerobolus stellatus SS14]
MAETAKMQCDYGPLKIENLFVKVLFHWKCKQDMEIIDLLFPKATGPIEPVAKTASPEVTSPKSPLSICLIWQKNQAQRNMSMGPEWNSNFTALNVVQLLLVTWTN